MDGAAPREHLAGLGAGELGPGELGGNLGARRFQGIVEQGVIRPPLPPLPRREHVEPTTAPSSAEGNGPTPLRRPFSPSPATPPPTHAIPRQSD